MPTKNQQKTDSDSAWMEANGPKWEARIRDLGTRLGDTTFHLVCGAAGGQAQGAGFEHLARVAGEGAGDTTFGLDVEPERIVQVWAEQIAREQPLSVLTEDSGWRHLAPHSSAKGWEALATFDHGGPRVVIDPVDGTRNLMFDIRSAWASIALAPPGPSTPLLSEVGLGYLRELPDSRAAVARLAIAWPGTKECRLELHDIVGEGGLLSASPLEPDDEAKVDGGFFPFFRYHPDMREELAVIEATFFARLEALEGADLGRVYDDQYISNAGQLLLLCMSKYRMIADLRAHLAERRGRPSVTSKPYDVAAAIPIARAAGCVVTAPCGAVLDFELDTTTPVSFVAWANEPTRARLAPHLQATLDPEPDRT